MKRNKIIKSFHKLFAFLVTIMYLSNLVIPGFAQTELHTVSTAQELVQALSEATGKITIQLDGIIDINETIIIPAGADIKIKEGLQIKNGLKFSEATNVYKPMIIVSQGAVLVFGNENTSTNALVIDGNGKIRNSLIENKGKMILNGGKITNSGESITEGAGIRVFPSASLIMNGGEISGNITKETGGGIHIDTGGSFTLNDGVITNNQAWYGGGGIYASKDSIFVMNDGQITYNDTSYYRGGGIAIITAYAKINAGVFSNNSSSQIGGGIYVDNFLPMAMEKVFISENTATIGGGLWLCYRGGVDLKQFEGMAVVGNTATSRGDDFHSDKKQDNLQDQLIVNLASTMLGGGEIKWFEDYPGARYKGGQTIPLSPGVQSTKENISLHVSASQEDIQTARNEAKIIITNNHAFSGGGFANNGDLLIGTDENKPTKPVEPATPVEPTKPVEPATPVEPTKPVEPATPVEPTKPVEPATPVEPTKPVEPTTPVEPTKPVEPTTAVEPTKPVEPTTAVEPATPVKPSKPSTSKSGVVSKSKEEKEAALGGPGVPVDTDETFTSKEDSDLEESNNVEFEIEYNLTEGLPKTGDIRYERNLAPIIIVVSFVIAVAVIGALIRYKKNY